MFSRFPKTNSGQAGWKAASTERPCGERRASRERRWSRLVVALVVALVFVGLWMGGAGAGFSQVERQRLILKDGTFQVVTRYEVKGDRVRYQSAERGNEWEELPYALVDWAATEAWTRAHSPGAAESQAEGDAAGIDKQAAAERAAEAARQPTVAKGLRLPDESGVWGLDTFHDVPEVVRVNQANGNLNRATGHTVQPAAIPLGGAKELMEIPGPRSGVQFHVADPVFYVSVDAPDNPAPDSALVVDTHGESRQDKEIDKRERSDPHSRYVVLRLHWARSMRSVSAIELAELRRPLQTGDIVQTRTELMAGGHWLKVTPAEPLMFGEYVLVELLSPTELNLDAWDFGVDPRAPENKHPFSPLESSPDGQEP